MLSDLRESGAIEQDADLVLFVYRPEYYKIEDDEKGNTAGMADIIISKHRNGALDDIRLRFQKECAKFIDPETNPTDFPPMQRNEQFDNEGNTGFVLLKSKMDDPHLDNYNSDILPEDDGLMDF
jgi:replicative DNA helicase